MQRIGLIVLVGLIVTGCGAGSAAAPTSAPSPGGIVTVTPGPVSMTEFIASDQALVGRTGRPQIVEFFAFW